MTIKQLIEQSNIKRRAKRAKLIQPSQNTEDTKKMANS